MKFGPVAIDRAEGALLAHALDVGSQHLRKAHRLSAADIATLQGAGVDQVIAAVLEPGDLDEDAAATRIVSGLRTAHVEARPAATGRVNLYAERAGVFCVEPALVDALNAIDPAITLATLPRYACVEPGQMVATVKIIPFGVARDLVERAVAVAAGYEIFAVHPFAASRVGVVQTVLPGIKDSVLAKTLRITEARLARSGSRVVRELRTPHSEAPLAEALTSVLEGADLAILFGASAVSDFDDVIPAAIRAAGGTVRRVGMPVDPGNLLVLGEVGGKTVIGAPGCARSPKENGFDWVLDRLAAGIDVSPRDIAGMGVGGLLMEIPSRPLPREATRRSTPGRVHIVLLAAGRSSRMGGPNKLMALFDGEPLVRRVAAQSLASKASSVTVVTGHQSERIGAALAGLGLRIVHNTGFAEGLSCSLRAGVEALPADAAGALVVLGDMPGVTTRDLDRMIAAFAAADGTAIVRATHEGKRGNPVLLPRGVFEAVSRLTGDTGARHLVESEGLAVIEVEIGSGASVDVDTAQAMADAGGVLQD